MICKICNKELKAINNSHLRQHNITLEQYREMFPGAECGQELRTLTEEGRERIRQHATSRKKKPEEIEKLRAYRKTFRHSEETKKKMSETRKGRKAWNKGKKGTVVHTQEYKELMRKLSAERVSNWNKNKRTGIELKISELLIALGIEYEEQKLMYDKFVVDFYIPSKNLIIECNGNYWHNRPNQKKKDRARINYLTKCGHKIIVLWEHEINENIAQCKEEILNG